MVHSTQEQPRERRDHAFWDTHFRQRGYKRPGQQQQQHPGLHHGSGGSSSQTYSLNPNNSNPSKALSSPAHHPRPFDHIETERQHLQHLLAEQDRRAVDLFSRVAAVDEACDFGSAHEQRQARRDRAWLQRRIGQTVDREREILVRLGDIHVEIQCQERWHMVEQQKAFLRQQGGRHRHGDWGWGSEGNGLNQPERQVRGSGASHRYCQDEVEPAIVSSYVHQQQQQHACPTNPRYPSMTDMPWTGVTEWYPDFATSASVNWSRRRTSGAQVGGQVRLLEESPAYRPRRSSYLSNASYATEVDERHGPSFDPVLPISRLPDRRRSLPTMHYNWDGGGNGGGSGHRCLGYIGEE
ncbi:Pyruvate formate lyase activating enzyme [Apiospora sp. TS-2023a]